MLSTIIKVNGVNTSMLNVDSSGIIVAGHLTSVDKHAVVGPDEGDGLMVLTGSVTATSASAQTNVFAVAFGAAPVVTATYTEDPGDVQPLYITGITTTNMVVNITADTDYSYIAVGTRP